MLKVYWYWLFMSRFFAQIVYGQNRGLWTKLYNHNIYIVVVF